MANTNPKSWQVEHSAALSELGLSANSSVEAVLNALSGFQAMPFKMAVNGANSNALEFGVNTVTLGDGTKKVTHPLDGVFSNFLGLVIDLSTGTKTGSGTLTLDGGAFSLPTTTIGQYRRLAFVYKTDNSIDCTFSAADASQGSLTNPGTLFDSLDGMPLGYIDLQAYAATEYKTAGNGTDDLANDEIYVVGSQFKLPDTVVEADVDKTITGTLTLDTELGFKQIATPSNPSAGYMKMYPKADGSFYTLDENGNEIAVGSGAGGGVKNYIENPDAATGVGGVTGSATTGSWSITAISTDSELPEESKGTGFKISGSGLTVNDYVAWPIISTGIDDADGGKMGSWEVAVKDISTTISGQYKWQVYNVTQSIYVGNSQTVVSDRVYYGTVPLNAAEDYELHLIALTDNPTNIGVSGATISPESARVSTFGGWPQYDDSVVTFSSTPTGWSLTRAVFVPYKDPINNIWRMTFNIRAAITAGSTPTVTIDGVTFKSGYSQALTVRTASASVNANAHAVSNTGQISIVKDAASSEFNVSGDVELESKPTWANFDNTVLTATEAQLQNSKARFYRSAAGGYSLNTAFVFDTTDTTTYEAPIGINNSSGIMSVDQAGTYDIICALSANPAWAANSQMTLHVNRNGGGYIQERIITRPGAAAFTLSGPASVYLTPNDLFQIQVNASATINQGSSLCYIEIRKRSARGAQIPGFPFTDIATSTKQYLVPDYREASKPYESSLTAGTFHWTRVGRLVIMEWNGLTHDAATSASTSAGFVPDGFKPASEIRSCNYYDETRGENIIVYANGTVFINYKNETGSVSLSAFQNGSISYITTDD